MPKKNDRILLSERIEDFLYSETIPATATKYLLAILGLGGIVFVGAAAPGIFRMMEEFSYAKGNKKTLRYSRKQVSNAIFQLKRNKLIKIVKEKDGKATVKLTNKGRKRMIKMSMNFIAIRKPKIWDGKWRIIVFDIPVKLNIAREALRRKMKNLGFKQFQKSVWIIPYECEDEILFISEMLEVEKYVEIIVAEKLLHEESARKAFKI